MKIIALKLQRCHRMPIKKHVNFVTKRTVNVVKRLVPVAPAFWKSAHSYVLRLHRHTLDRVKESVLSGLFSLHLHICPTLCCCVRLTARFRSSLETHNPIRETNTKRQGGKVQQQWHISTVKLHGWLKLWIEWKRQLMCSLIPFQSIIFCHFTTKRTHYSQLKVHSIDILLFIHP